MKRTTLLFTCILVFAFAAQGRIVTSQANGNATNPLTWDCTCIPVDGDTINIQHTVVLDVDYAFTMGGITIFPAGALNGNVNTRIFGVSGGFFVNMGSITMGYLAHNGGTFLNQGTITVLGSLLIDQAVTLTNNATIVASDSLLINTFAGLQNGGSVSTGECLSAGTITNLNGASIDCLNLFSTGTVNNNAGGTITTTFNLFNTGTMTFSGMVDVGGDVLNAENMTIGSYMEAQSLWNGDSINGTATFTNNGTVSLSNSLYNSEDISGTGDFCIADSSVNSGAISGTVDICDQTGGGWDINFGTETGTVTHCANGPCTIGVRENQSASSGLIATPNPATNEIKVQLPSSDEGNVMIIDITGRVVMNVSSNGSMIVLNVEQLSPGAYTIVYNGSQFQRSGMFIKE